MRNYPQIENLRHMYLRTRIESNGCLVWLGTIAKNGYGEAYYYSKKYIAHRLAWLLYSGQLPEKQINHKCCNKACINILHLEDVSASANMRHYHQNKEEKTYCIKGHQFTPENTYIDNKGSKVCRACRRQQDLFRNFYK